jgi:hypothetical protein
MGYSGYSESRCSTADRTLLPLSTLARTHSCVRPTVCASVCEYVCGVSVRAFEGLRVSLLLRGALGVLRRMGGTLGYSRGTPKKCVRAGLLTAAFLLSAHLLTSVRLRSDAVDARADDRRAGRCAVGYELP